jgi:hypothetical protein
MTESTVPNPARTALICASSNNGQPTSVFYNTCDVSPTVETRFR